MPVKPSPPESTGDVLFHLTCAYHGELGTEISAAAAAIAAALHIRTMHVDAEGNIAPGAEISVVSKTHITPAHLAAIDKATPPGAGPSSGTSA